MISGGLFFFNLSVSVFAASAAPSVPISITLSGNKFFSSSYLLRSSYNMMSAGDVEKTISGILDFYAEAGFALCSVVPVVSHDDSGRISVALEINEGTRIKVSGYEYRANGGKTSPGALRRISLLRDDAYFNIKDIKKAKSVFMNTGVFSSVSERIVENLDDYYVVFDLAENPTDYINGSGSIAQDNVILGAAYESASILGTLRQFSFTYESGMLTDMPGQLKNLFALSFSDPVSIAPVIVDVNFSLTAYDTARLSLINGRVTAPVGAHVKTSVLSGLEMVDYLADASRPGYRNSLVGLGLGASFENGTAELTQNIEIDYLFRTRDRLRLRYDGVLAWRSLNLRPHAVWTRTDRFEFFDYWRIGGARDIRGYQDNEFAVERAGWLNIEYKKLPLYPLMDMAWLDRGFLYAYGLGIDAESSFASATLILAWPKNGSWNDGKVHFILQKGL
jgi:hypothetical protein